MKRALLLLALLSACTEVHVVERETLEAEQFFVVTLDGGGVVREVSAIYETATAEQVLFDVDGDAEGVFLVGLSRVRLRAADARFDDTRAASLSVLIAAPPEPAAVFLREDEAFVRRALPNDARIVDARKQTEASGGARESIERALTIELPITTDGCVRDQPRTLAPFGATAELLADGPPELADRKYREVLRVTGEGARALLLTEGALYVVERGQAIDPQLVLTTMTPDFETRALPASALGAGVTLRAIAPFFRPIDGQPQFLLGGDQDGAAAIFRIALGVGGVRLVERVLIEQTPPPGPIRDILIDGQHIAVAVGDGGMVLTSERIDRPFDRAEGPTGQTAQIRRAAPSHILTQPHAIATDGSELYLGYAFGEYWDEVKTPARVNAIAASIDGDELWIAGDRGLVMRRRDSTFALAELIYPTSVKACGGRDAETNRVTIDDDLAGAALDESFVYLQPKHCAAMLRVRRSDLCVSAIAGDEGAGTPEAERTTVGGWGDTVVVGGTSGLLMEVVR